MKEEDQKKATDHTENITLNSNGFIIVINFNILNHIFSQIDDEMTSLALIQLVESTGL